MSENNILAHRLINQQNWQSPSIDDSSENASFRSRATVCNRTTKTLARHVKETTEHINVNHTRKSPALPEYNAQYNNNKQVSLRQQIKHHQKP